MVKDSSVSRSSLLSLPSTSSQEFPHHPLPFPRPTRRSHSRWCCLNPHLARHLLILIMTLILIFLTSFILFQFIWFFDPLDPFVSSSSWTSSSPPSSSPTTPPSVGAEEEENPYAAPCVRDPHALQLLSDTMPRSPAVKSFPFFCDGDMHVNHKHLTVVTWTVPSPVQIPSLLRLTYPLSLVGASPLHWIILESQSSICSLSISSLLRHSGLSYSYFLVSEAGPFSSEDSQFAPLDSSQLGNLLFMGESSVIEETLLLEIMAAPLKENEIGIFPLMEMDEIFTPVLVKGEVVSHIPSSGVPLPSLVFPSWSAFVRVFGDSPNKDSALPLVLASSFDPHVAFVPFAENCTKVFSWWVPSVVPPAADLCISQSVVDSNIFSLIKRLIIQHVIHQL